MELSLSVRCAVLALATLAVLWFTEGTVSAASAGNTPPTIEELQKRLDERDAVIRDLLHRVEMLEKGRPAGTRSASAPTTPRTDSAANAPAAAAIEPSDRPASSGRVPEQTAQAPAPAPSAPGEFEIDKDAAERALERALVQSGALLLSAGTVEIAPSVSFVRRESATPGQLVFPTTVGVLVANNKVRQNQLETALLFRAGLPWDAQAEIGLPYDYKSTSTATMVGTAGLSEQTTKAWGFGDPTLSVLKQLSKEGEWLPSLLAGLTWDSDFGQTKHGIALGTGFNELKASLTATKRQDPLVFTTSLGYQTAFSKHGIQPGDQYLASAGIFFAVSPETSLLFSPQLAFANDTKFNGARVPGSDQLSAVLELGLITVLAPRFLLDFRFDVGLTNDAPKFGLKLLFPSSGIGQLTDDLHPYGQS